MGPTGAARAYIDNAHARTRGHMLKMAGSGLQNGKTVKLVILGFSRLNLDRLGAGQPIEFDGEEVNLPGVRVVIFAGSSEESMARELADLVGPQTQTRIDPRTTN